MLKHLLFRVKLMMLFCIFIFPIITQLFGKRSMKWSGRKDYPSIQLKAGFKAQFNKIKFKNCLNPSLIKVQA